MKTLVLLLLLGADGGSLWATSETQTVQPMKVRGSFMLPYALSAEELEAFRSMMCPPAPKEELPWSVVVIAVAAIACFAYLMRLMFR